MKKRKFFAAVLATAISASMAFNAIAATKLAAPTVWWSTEKEALPSWSTVDGAAGKYRVQAYKDGDRFSNVTHSFAIDSESRQEFLTADGFVNRLESSGIYKFRVMALGDKNNTEDSDWSAFSSDWNFQKASAVLPAPTNLRWDGTTACWNIPEIPAESEPYLKGWEVELLADGEARVILTNVQGSSYDLASWMTDDSDPENAGVKEWTFNVRAVSNTPSVVFHSSKTYGDDAYHTDEENASVSDKLDSILQSENAEDLSAAPDTLKEDRSRLQVAMQTDPAVLAQVEELESRYAEANNVTFNQNIDPELEGFDAKQVSVVGAMLNAADSNTTVSLNIGKPEREEVIDETPYRNAIQIDFHLEGAVSDLKVPVRLTIPVPAGINPDFLHILHYRSDGTVEDFDTFSLQFSADKKFVSFTVTGFSTFAIVEEGMDVDKVATPSNAEEIRKMANSLPDYEAGMTLTAEEEALVKAALEKIAAALNSGKIDPRDMMDQEETLAKLSGLLDLVNAMDFSIELPDLIDKVSYAVLASGAYGNDDVTGLVFLATASNATPSNAAKANGTTKKILVDISMYLQDSLGDLSQTASLKSPIRIDLTLPDKFGYTYSSSDTISVDGGKAELRYENGQLSILTTELGTFTITTTDDDDGDSDTPGGDGGNTPGGDDKPSGGNGGKSEWVRPASGRVLTQNTAPKNGSWILSSTGWWFLYEDGTWPENTWVQLSWNNQTNWYFFNADGYMATGWLFWNSHYYYLHPMGDGTRGFMYTGWHEIDGKWYYFDSTGAMAASTTTPDGYRVGADGVWVQ